MRLTFLPDRPRPCPPVPAAAQSAAARSDNDISPTSEDLMNKLTGLPTLSFAYRGRLLRAWGHARVAPPCAPMAAAYAAVPFVDFTVAETQCRILTGFRFVKLVSYAFVNDILLWHPFFVNGSRPIFAALLGRRRGLRSVFRGKRRVSLYY